MNDTPNTTQPAMELPALPEPDAQGTAYHPELKICYSSDVNYSPDLVREIQREAFEAGCASASSAAVGELSDELLHQCALAGGFSVEPGTGHVWAVDGDVGTVVTPGLRKFAAELIAAARPSAPPSAQQEGGA